MEERGELKERSCVCMCVILFFFHSLSFSASPGALLVANTERIFYIQINENNHISQSLLPKQPQITFLNLTSDVTVRGNKMLQNC